MLGNDKHNVIVNYLFTKLVFVLKLSGLKSLMNLHLLLEDADSLKMSFIFFNTTYLQKPLRND